MAGESSAPSAARSAGRLSSRRLVTCASGQVRAKAARTGGMAAATAWMRAIRDAGMSFLLGCLGPVAARCCRRAVRSRCSSNQGAGGLSECRQQIARIGPVKMRKESAKIFIVRCSGSADFHPTAVVGSCILACCLPALAVAVDAAAAMMAAATCVIVRAGGRFSGRGQR